MCLEVLCGTKTFTKQFTAVPARARLTTRLRDKLAAAIASGNRAVSEVATEYGVAWATAHQALIAAATRWLPEPEPTRMLGIDETRARSVRWVLEEAGWRRSDPWMTSFVDADTTAPGRLLGLTPGRSGSCVTEWLALQTQAFRDGIELVVIDLCDGDVLPIHRPVSRAMQAGLKVGLIDPVVASIVGPVPFQGPFGIGHECVAQVTAIGDEVVDVKFGDIVVVPWRSHAAPAKSASSA